MGLGGRMRSRTTLRARCTTVALAAAVVSLAAASGAAGYTYTSTQRGAPPDFSGPPSNATCNGQANDAGGGVVSFSLSCDVPFVSFALRALPGHKETSTKTPGEAVTGVNVPGFECLVGDRQPQDPADPRYDEHVIFCKLPGAQPYNSYAEASNPPPEPTPVSSVSGSYASQFQPTASICTALDTIFTAYRFSGSEVSYSFEQFDTGFITSIGPNPCATSGQAAAVPPINSTQQLGAVLAKGLVVPATCQTACSITSRLYTSASTLSAARRVLIAKGAKKLKKAATTTVRLRFKSTAKARLHRKRKVKALLVTRAVPQGKKAVVKRQRITLKR